MDKKHIVLYTLAIGVMSVGGWLAAGPLPGARTSGSCCNTSEDCTLSGYLCYKPSGGLADCSPTKPNYCFQQQPN